MGLIWGNISFSATTDLVRNLNNPRKQTSVLAGRGLSIVLVLHFNIAQTQHDIFYFNFTQYCIHSVNVRAEIQVV